MKKYFAVSFKYSESVYCSNIAHAETAEAVNAHYSKYEWVSVRECEDYEVEAARRKGMPIVEVETPEAVTEEPGQKKEKMKNEYTNQAEKFLQDANATIKIELQGRAINTAWKEKQPRNLYAVTIATPRGSYTFDFWDSLYNTELTQTTVEQYAQKHFRMRYEDMTYSEQKKARAELAIKQKEARPTCYDVLACLTKYDPGTFEDFCSEYGYNEDSRTAERIYIAVHKEFANLKRIFDPKQLEAMHEIE